MTTPCHPIPASLAQHYLAQTKAALCDRPGESAAENAERTKRMVHTAMGFEPRDGMEYMLATLVQAQYEVILKATKDALQGTEDAASPKAISALAAMNRVMLSTIRALKTARERPLAEDEDAPQTAQPEPPKPQPVHPQPAPPPRAARPGPMPAPPLPDRKTVTPLPGLPRPPEPAFHAPPKAA